VGFRAGKPSKESQTRPVFSLMRVSGGEGVGFGGGGCGERIRFDITRYNTAPFKGFRKERDRVILGSSRTSRGNIPGASVGGINKCFLWMREKGILWTRR